MFRTIQRLAAFVIFSSILISGCQARPVTISGLYAATAEEGQDSTLNFKLRNPTDTEIILYAINLQPVDRGDTDGDGKNEIYIYSYVTEMHRIETTDQGRKDEVVREIRIPAGKIIEFKPDGEYYIRLVYKKPEKPAAEPQKGLPHGYNSLATFSFSIVGTSGDPPIETRTEMGFPWQEVFIK